jgi:glycosyltransferase involved in cell wall biosynthesis
MSKSGSRAAAIPTLNLMNIIYSIFGNASIITGKYNDDLISSKIYPEIRIIGVSHVVGTNALSRIFNYVLAQLNISNHIFKLKSDADLFMFFMMGQDLIFPMLVAKIFRKKVILILAVSSEKSSKAKNDPFFAVLTILSKINYYLSYKIIIYSYDIIKELGLEMYEYKIMIAYEHYVDLNKFAINNEFDLRPNIVGYVGRLSEEKGILNFVESINTIYQKDSELNFIICGGGHLFDRIKQNLIEHNLIDRVKLTGWILHEDLIKYLNIFRLIVVPSYTEGLPNIILEAMACNTPVLATSVGAIGDVIKDGETGFIMENNSSECIAANIIRALEHPDLKGIVKRARALVEREFTFEKAVERWWKVLEEMDDGER